MKDTLEEAYEVIRNPEYDEIQQIRRDLTHIASRLERLTQSNNLELKKIAREILNSIDNSRRQIFDYNG